MEKYSSFTNCYFLLAHFDCAHLESTYCTAFLNLGYLGLISIIQHFLTNLSIKGCHFVCVFGVGVRMEWKKGKVFHLCSVTSDSLQSQDCRPSSYSVNGIFQARTLEWVAISSSRGSSEPRVWTEVFWISRWILYCWAIREAHEWSACHQFPSACHHCIYSGLIFKNHAIFERGIMFWPWNKKDAARGRRPWQQSSVRLHV